MPLKVVVLGLSEGKASPQTPTRGSGMKQTECGRCCFASCVASSSTYLHKERVGLIVDGVRVVELAVVPQDLAHRRVLLGHGEHPLRIAALGQQLPAQRGRGKQ